MNYNTNSHSKNALLSIFSGIGGTALNALVTFAYRTVFLVVLTKEYLGIEGVFSSVLQLLSLTELGIGQVIVYRMYRPFKEKDIEKVSAYMRFFKYAYYAIALGILCFGLLLIPFLDKLVDYNEIPKDVDIILVYVLYLVDNACSYLFTYKRNILEVNQKTYVNNMISSLLLASIAIIKSIVVIITRNFELTLVFGILAGLVFNFVVCQVITKKNNEVFYMKTKLSGNEKRRLIKDCYAVMAHKIGGTVLYGTDNLVLSVFVSLKSVALYSNYSLITKALEKLISHLFGSYEPVIANCIIEKSNNDVAELYEKITFANQWISSCTTVCLYVLINPFISIWLDDSFLFDSVVVVVLCAQYYITCTRIPSTAFINASGLFVRDKVRPLIEATLNLVISIVLVKVIGIGGVFVGTCVSELVTCYWREIYLLNGKGYVSNIRKHIVYRLYWLMSTLLCAWLANKVWLVIRPTWVNWFIISPLLFISINCMYIFALKNSKGYHFIKGFINNICKKSKGEILD